MNGVKEARTSKNFVAKNRAILKSLDLICHRYPGTRPSQLLKIKDEYDAFRIDIAGAYLGEFSEYDRQNALNDELIAGMIMIAKTMGAKRIKQPKREKLVSDIIENREPTVEEVLQQLKTPGTIIERKNG